TGGDERNPFPTDEDLRPHVKSHSGALLAVVGIAQAQSRSRRQSGGPTQRRSQEAVLPAIALQSLGYLSGRREGLGIADAHVRVYPAFNGFGLFPWVSDLSHGTPGVLFDPGIIAVDPIATLEVLILGGDSMGRSQRGLSSTD